MSDRARALTDDELNAEVIWEERMSQRAHERNIARQAARDLTQEEEEGEATRDWWELSGRQKAAYRQHTYPMTRYAALEHLGRFVNQAGFWCACVGGINCCLITYEQAELVLAGFLSS